MHWVVWAALPLPLLSLCTLVYALTHRDTDPRQRAVMMACSGGALLLGTLLIVLLAVR